MASLNKVFLVGNLTRLPNLRYTPGGSAVCELGLAVNRKFVANGQEKEETCFVDIVVWGKQAELCNRFLDKGSAALVEGRLQLDQWEDKESNAKRSRLRVVAERVQFLGRNERKGEDAQRDFDQQAQNYGEENQMSGQQRPSSSKMQPQKPAGFQKQGSQPEAPPSPGEEVFNGEDVEDDIPF